MINDFIPEIWSASLLQRFVEDAKISATANHQYEGDARMGNSVRITSIQTPTVIDYAQGTNGWRTATPEYLDDSSQSLLIDQERAFSFYVDDVDARQAAGSFEPVVADAGAALVEESETHLSEKMIAGAETVTATVATGDDAFNLVKGMRTTLSTRKVPQSDRFLLVNPEFAGLLLGADSKLVDVDTSGDPAGLRDATIGRLLGFQVVESPLITATGPAAFGYHRTAIAHVPQIEQVEALRATDRFADIMRGLAVYGAKVVRPNALLFWNDAA